MGTVTYTGMTKSGMTVGGSCATRESDADIAEAAEVAANATALGLQATASGRAKAPAPASAKPGAGEEGGDGVLDHFCTGVGT
mmetsp:Transcript_37678/g.70272  ORF Transcript_37678/g.70272 Transcript_37678/m.70272 type:complete len:83 (+) Transcript_37678:164-412(+)